MTTYKTILADLLARESGELTDDRLGELAATAQTLASLGANAPPVKPPAPKVDRKQEARAKYEALMAKPLPPHTNDRLKAARAHERAQLLAVIHDMEGRTDHNGYFVRSPKPDPEAA